MTIPDYQQFMRPVLEGFANGAATAAEVLPHVAAAFQLTDEEAEQLLPSGRKTVLSDRAHWARTYFSKAGLLESPRRGHHRVTQRGRGLLEEHQGPITNEVLARFPEFVAWREESARPRTGRPLPWRRQAKTQS